MENVGNMPVIKAPNTAEYSAEVRPNSKGGRVEAEPNIRPNSSAEYSVLPNFGTSLLQCMNFVSFFLEK